MAMLYEQISHDECFVEAAHALGGFRTIDRHLRFMLQPYNPMTPEQDTRNAYEWRICSMIFPVGVYQDDFSVTVPLPLSPSHAVGTASLYGMMAYYRRAR